MSLGYRVQRTSGVPVERVEEVRGFWSRNAALAAHEVAERLGLVAALVLDPSDAVAGTCSVVDAPVPLVGHRRFWVYRRLLAADVPAAIDEELFFLVFDDLDREHEAGADNPIGMCMVDRPRPEAVLPGTGLFLAGYTPAGEQLRVRYFAGALIR